MSTDKKLSELSALSRFELAGGDYLPVLDNSEVLLADRNKIVELEELYQYINTRIQSGGDAIYLLKGINSTQEGYFKAVHVNTLLGNTDSNGTVIAIGDGVSIQATANIQAAAFLDAASATTGISLGTANTIVFLSSGSEKARIDTSGLLSLGGDTDTGIRLAGINQLAARSGGTDIVIIDPTAININGEIKLIAGDYDLTLSHGVFTSNRTILFPDVNGTVVTTGDTGTVTSAMIASGTIVNDDINTAAAITVSKLAPGSARTLLQSNASGNAVEWTSSVDLAGTLDVTGIVTFDSSLSVSSGASVGENLALGGSIIFEGTTVNDFETTLSVGDPTADRSLVLPDVSGTIVTTGDTGTVTSTMILNGTIVNADISASAAITDTKLDTITSANKVSANSIDLDAATDIGSALADADLFLVDDGGTGTNRKAAATRISTYTFSKVSGDITINSSGVSTLGSSVVSNANVSSNADIAVSKLANGTTDQLLQTNSAGTDAEWTNSIRPSAITMTGTGALKLAAGTEAQRPSPATDGMLRYNQDAGCLEAYVQSSWQLIPYNVLDYGLITAAVANSLDYGALV